MRVLLAFDKFKDALSARAICEAAADALQARHPDWQLDACPLTDGGEGFCETLTHAAQGRLTQHEITGPRGTPVLAPIGYASAALLPAAARERLRLHPRQLLGIVEMAAASGLALLPPGKRDPWRTTTRGTGELLRLASAAGADTLLLGVGGSATNDLGLGALSACGFRFLDHHGEEIKDPIPARWPKIARITPPAELPLAPLAIACDVTNPLLGAHGATATFGPQKGLSRDDIPAFDAEMARLTLLLSTACGTPPALVDQPGAGAAGGIAGGLMLAVDAQLVSGFDLVSAWLDLPRRIAEADLVLTGEGRFDTTSLGGKGPGGLVTAARAAGKPVHVFAGALAVPENDSLHAITPPDLPLAQALPRTAELLAAALARVF